MVRVGRRQFAVRQSIRAADDQAGGQRGRSVALPEVGGIVVGKLQHGERAEFRRVLRLFGAALGEKQHAGDLAGLAPLGQQRPERLGQRGSRGGADDDIGRRGLRGDGGKTERQQGGQQGERAEGKRGGLFHGRVAGREESVPRVK